MRTQDLLEQLLTCAQQELELPVCKAFIHPGTDAPHDVCEAKTVSGGAVNGQLWVAVTLTQDGWPEPDPNPTSCRSNWTDFIEVGIVRCAQGILDDEGNPPAEDLITADAQQQLEDRNALRDAILCCITLQGKDFLFEGWSPISPQGGCVGGTWTFRSRDGGCTCGSDT